MYTPETVSKYLCLNYLSELVEEVKVELSNLNYSFGGEWVAWLGEIIDPVYTVEVWLEVGVY